MRAYHLDHTTTETAQAVVDAGVSGLVGTVLLAVFGVATIAVLLIFWGGRDA